MTDMSKLQELQQDMQTFYHLPTDETDEPDESETFFELFEDDLCAVLYQCEWFRGIVQSIDNQINSVSVFLVDFGRRVTVPSFNIRVITTYFASFGPLSFPCKLMPLNSNDSRKVKALVTKFTLIREKSGSIQMQYLTDQMPYIVRILVSQYRKIGKEADAYILSPSYAVFAIEKIHSDRVKWIASNIDDQDHSQRCYSSAMNKKVDVIVTAIRSPAEIYLNTRRSDAEKRKMHAAIQRWAIDHQMRNQHLNEENWKNGDQCLVHVRRSNEIEMWYRGLIDAVNGNELHVFLRDFGDVVDVKAKKAMRTIDKLVRMCDRVVKCHLDGVNSWLPSSICILQSMIGEGFASFASKVNGSVPITLWRPTQEMSCGQIVEWMNLNRWLVAATVIEVTETYIQMTQEEFSANAEWKELAIESFRDQTDGSSFEEHSDLNDILLEDVSTESNDALISHDEYEDGAAYFRISEPFFYELNEWVEGVVERWLPSVRTERLIFNGTPIYIDHNCVFYIHDTYRTYLAQHLSVYITRAIENDENVFDPFTVNWTVGQTCFAKYDEQFHRGTIKSVNRAKCMCTVKFVDYGNCDPCKFEDMRPATQYGHIPILVRKYCLDNVLPISDDNRWPVSTVNVLRNDILQHRCTIRVKEISNQDIGILPCSIARIDDRIDVKTRLIEMGFCYERVISMPQHRHSNILIR